MSAPKIKNQAIKKINTGKYPLIIMNFANADMVGHSGNLKATIRAVSTIDRCLGDVAAAARKKGYNVIITSDHGNAEEMSGNHRTSHTMNKVPFILLSNTNYKIVERKDNSLANISPTILKLMGLKIPKAYSKPLIT